MDGDISLSSVFDWVHQFERCRPVSFKNILIVIGDIWMTCELRKRYNVILEVDFDTRGVYDLLCKCHRHSIHVLDACKPTVIYIDNTAFLEKRLENDISRFIGDGSKRGAGGGKSIPIIVNILYADNILVSFRERCKCVFVNDFERLSLCLSSMSLGLGEPADDADDADDALLEYKQKLQLHDEMDNADNELTLLEYKQKLEKIIFY